MAYSVYSYPAFYTSTGCLSIYAGTSEGHAPAVIQLIREEVDDLMKNGITAEEFHQTREQIKGNHVLGMESSSSRMNSLGRRMLLMGNTQTEDQMLEKLNAVTHEQVNEVIREILSGPCAAALVGKGADKLDMSAFGL